ncbi:MAG: sugar phosphate isomerase/epimerase, partial [Acidobacteriaceae bacterium]|nr:sugar phosphate isomerase/epimerase [Acidobacteriaceae bacterium]
MKRREFVALAGASPLMRVKVQAPGAKLGIDLFSLRGQKWTPFEYLEYCAKQRVQVVHFSEIRFLGSLEPDNLRRVRDRARELGLEIEIGMKSICPTSKMFEPSQGTAEQQLGRMIDAANVVGSKIVRAVLGSADDRTPGPLSARIDDTVRVLKNVRSKAIDQNVKIAIENHAGDMQGWQLKSLVEAAGPDFVGVCLDSGNPLWTMEDPHVTLDVLHPYVLTSHVRDSAVWRVPEGAAVTWVVMGRGNVDIASYVRRYVELCPGKALSMETILLGPRVLGYRDRNFWNGYREIPAWNFEQFVELAESGQP